MADTIKTNLGPVTAYADAKAHGYTGTREEFGVLLANAGLNLKAAETAKADAEAAKQAAETAQQAAAENQKNTETQAANAKASADTAAEQAAVAEESAADAANSATAAQESETNAGLSATAAANAEAAAKQAQNAAETAKADAETAKTAAGNSADAAANSAADAKKTLESIPADYSTLSGKVNDNTSGISGLKEELTQCEEYVGIEYPEIEPVEGKYYLSTNQASSNRLSHSQILVLHNNDKIVIECCAYFNLANTIPALVRFNAIDSANPNGTLVQGSYEYETYSYTATDETYVAFNWRNETGYKVKIYRYQWETVDVLKDGYNILTDFVAVSPGYIQSSTGNATGTNRKHTELFALRYGETIEIAASGYATGTVSILHRYNSDGLNLGPVYAPKESGQKVYYYTETKAIGYYKASSYSEILVIKKYSSPEGIRETIW